MLAVGTVLIDRYRITGYIHKGAMGAVYRAHDRLDNVLVAVKQSFYAEQEELREQFRREATLLRRLNHPVLPKVYNYFTEGMEQFLVMDCIEGDDLEILLRHNGCPFPLMQVTEWADALLDALKYIHTYQPPVIHRDIKPGNLKLTLEGQTKLLDFGLAKSASTPTLPGGSLHGYTLAYSSPEQREGTGTDARSDIYSLGATLYRLLTYQEPVDSHVREGVIRNSVRDPLKPAHVLNSAVPLTLSNLIRRAMALDPAERFQSAAKMRAELLDGREAKQVSRPLESFLPPPSKPGDNDLIVLASKKGKTSSRPVPSWQSLPTGADDDSTRLASKRRETPSPLVRSRWPWLIGAAVAALLLSLLGYWLLHKQLFSSGKPSVSPTPLVKVRATPVVRPTRIPTTSEVTEVLRYALDYNPTDKRKFRFHFKPSQNGYLYIVAPDDKLRLTTFLTSHPHPSTGVKTNRLMAGKDFQFFGGERWVEMASDSVSFTLVFAAQPLTQFSFFNAQAGRQLSEAEQNTLDDLRRHAQARDPLIRSNGRGATITALETADKPLVIDIRVGKDAR